MTLNVFSNLQEAGTQNRVPVVGDGATINYASDRTACTIIRVMSATLIIVQEDTSIRTDGNGMSDQQSYSYAPNPKGRIHFFSKRKNGRWVEKNAAAHNGLGCSIGIRKEFYDYTR